MDGAVLWLKMNCGHTGIIAQRERLFPPSWQSATIGGTKK
jgi:hypothetical protein